MKAEARWGKSNMKTSLRKRVDHCRLGKKLQLQKQILKVTVKIPQSFKRNQNGPTKSTNKSHHIFYTELSRSQLPPPQKKKKKHTHTPQKKKKKHTHTRQKKKKENESISSTSGDFSFQGTEGRPSNSSSRSEDSPDLGAAAPRASRRFGALGLCLGFFLALEKGKAE